MKTHLLIALIAILSLSATNRALANDLVRLGGSSASQGAGNIAGLAGDAISGLASNPAFISRSGNQTQLGLATVYVDSDFFSSSGQKSAAEAGPGILPEFALSRQISDSAWAWGAGLVVQSGLSAEFDFLDPPGTLGVSYGNQIHRAEYAVVKAAAALSYQVNDALALGWSVGIAYNRNQLEAPYIFQSHPTLRGLKVLVDLDTDDIALTSSIGLDYRISPTLSVNLAHTLQSDFAATGKLDGNLAALGLGFQETFSYDARVSTALPASTSAGLVWEVSERFRIGLQFDSIDWSASFNELPISLSNGSNADLNGFLGEDLIRDTAPLDWRDQRVLHLGMEYQLSGGKQLRWGIERSNVPVPRSTVTPLTGAILNSALSIGIGIPLAERKLDISYRFTDSDGSRVSVSSLAGGEYNGTSQSVSLHTLSFTLSF